MNSIIVQFAILWGQAIGSALSSKKVEKARKMARYDSEELFQIFTTWAEDFVLSDEEDTVEFFEKKLTDWLCE